MMGNHSRSRPALRKGALPMALLIVLSGSAGAIDVDYEVGVAARHSDNINLSDDNPISDTVISPRMFFIAEQVGRSVELAAQGNVEYRYYTSDTFDNEVRGRFVGALNWMVLPQRLDFVVQDYLSLQPVDERVEFTPSNQQQVNVFVAGPTLHARFGGTTRGQLDMRYVNTYAEERDEFDSDRFTAAARLVRELTAIQSISANIEASDVDFDRSDQAADYRRYDGYVNTRMQRKRMDLSLDLGYSRLEFDENITLGSRDTDSSYPLARATVNWRMTPRSALGTTVRYQVTDATQSLMAPVDFDRRDFNDFRGPNTLSEPNVFRERMVRLRYRYTGDRTSVQFGPYYRRIRYLEEVVESQERRGLSLSLEHRLRPRLTLYGYAAREDREFLDVGREDEDSILSVGLENRFTRHWSGRVDLQRRERDSSEASRGYSENAIMVSFSYRR